MLSQHALTLEGQVPRPLQRSRQLSPPRLKLSLTLKGLPNKLTLLRLILAPCYSVLVLWMNPWSLLTAAIITVIALVTDWLDGYLARRTNQLSDFGACFDPIADKAFVLSALTALAALPQLGLSAAALIIIILREFLMTGFRVMLLLGHNHVVAADRFGKLKTSIQLIYIAWATLWLLFGKFYEADSLRHEGLDVGLWVVAILTVLSAWPYIWKNRQLLEKSWNSSSK